jgi:hypothetical protein
LAGLERQLAGTYPPQLCTIRFFPAPSSLSPIVAAKQQPPTLVFSVRTSAGSEATVFRAVGDVFKHIGIFVPFLLL